MPFAIPASDQPVSEAYTRLLDRVDRLAETLDLRFRIPWTNIRFGWDPIVGLIPIVGDLAMAAVSIQLMVWARELGADAAMLRRMALNVAIDTGLGAIPLAGPVFDVWFKANARNVQILTDEIRRRRSL